MSSPRRLHRRLTLRLAAAAAFVGLVAMLGLAPVTHAHSAAPSIGTAEVSVSTPEKAGPGTWAKKFGKKVRSKVNARKWTWLEKRGVSDYSVTQLKKLRKKDKIRLLRCDWDASVPDDGYCGYEIASWPYDVYFTRTSTGVRVVWEQFPD